MNWSNVLLIAAGGAMGSVARAGANWLLPAGRLPWATTVVNVLGSLLIGWLLVRLEVGTPAGLRWHSFLVVGLCGGFTTFSSFSWQTFEQIQKGQWAIAVAHVLLSVSFCLAATWLGWRLAR
jgi:CrcB protein